MISSLAPSGTLPGKPTQPTLPSRYYHAESGPGGLIPTRRSDGLKIRSSRGDKAWRFRSTGSIHDAIASFGATRLPQTLGATDCEGSVFMVSRPGAGAVRVGAHRKPHFCQFESPLLKLMIDYEYEWMVKGSQQRLLQKASSGNAACANHLGTPLLRPQFFHLRQATGPLQARKSGQRRQ